MLLATLALLLASGVPAPKYPADAIALALRENAHAVVRAYDEVVTVKSASQLVRSVHEVVTILDPAGSDEYGELTVNYNALNHINYLRGAVYDAQGHLLHQLRAAEVHDQGMGSAGGSFMTDLRVRYADLRQPATPYTVEFDYEITSENTLFYPDWQPQSEENVSLESATLQVTTPTALPLRYEEQLLPKGAASAPVVAGSQTTYRWQLAAQPAVEAEPLSPPLAELLPAVHLAPATFEVQGYAGSLASWQSLGLWTYQLGKGRDVLPPALTAKMAQLLISDPDPRARARKVYEFLQSSTRYVSVQLGLGGWQTAPAQAVATGGYGDCKALSNYTCALLKAAGLPPAYVALVGAGSGHADVRAAFPSSQFNHAILCMPLAAHGTTPADTVWLECTSQTDAFGYMGSFTGNRHALLLTPEGGRLVATPRYGAQANRQLRRTDLWLDATGSARATVRTQRVGLAQDLYAQLLHETTPDEQQKYVTNRLRLNHFTITSLRLTAAPTTAPALPGVLETMGLDLPGVATPAGRRLLLEPNLLSRLGALPAQVGARQMPLALPPASLTQDTVRLHIPAGFRVENLPLPVQLTSAYGTYTSSCQALPDGTLQYVRQLETRRPASTPLPAASYPDYQAFRRKVTQADQAQVVLIKTDA